VRRGNAATAQGPAADRGARYLLPLVARVVAAKADGGAEPSRYPRAPILVPNRELGTQLQRVAALVAARR
jgi:superfamily II DNA/RNA helicase